MVCIFEWFVRDVNVRYVILFVKDMRLGGIEEGGLTGYLSEKCKYNKMRKIANGY